LHIQTALTSQLLQQFSTSQLQYGQSLSHTT
jgi:hypothetical protein